MEELILSVRINHPTWGPKKILRHLVDKGNVGLPVPSTIASILKRNGSVSPEQSACHTPIKRFERASPNDLWQMDFKGYISVQRHRYYLSETFIDKYIELIPVGENILALCYGNFIIAKIDLAEELFISRKIYRR